MRCIEAQIAQKANAVADSRFAHSQIRLPNSLLWNRFAERPLSGYFAERPVLAASGCCAGSSRPRGEVRYPDFAARKLTLGTVGRHPKEARWAVSDGQDRVTDSFVSSDALRATP